MTALREGGKVTKAYVKLPHHLVHKKELLTYVDLAK